KRLAFWQPRDFPRKGMPDLAEQVRGPQPDLMLVEGITGKFVTVPAETFDKLRPRGTGNQVVAFAQLASGESSSLVWSPASQRLAWFTLVSSRAGASPKGGSDFMRQQENAKFDGIVLILDSLTGKEVFHVPGVKPSWNSDGRYVVLKHKDSDRVWDVGTRKEM